MKLTGEAAMRMYLEHIKGRGYASGTIKRGLFDIGYFFEWLLRVRGKDDVRDVNGGDLIEYVVHLPKALKKDGHGSYAMDTQRGMLVSLRSIFRYLSRNDYILGNPFDGLDLAMPRKRRERASIKEKDMGRFLDGIAGASVFDVRDRAIFELMYGTGLRVGEVAKLDLTDVDLNTGRLVVKSGKGRRDRIVPLGKNAAEHIKIYLTKARNEFLKYEEDACGREALFLSNRGRRVGVLCIQRGMQKHLEQSGVGKGSPHMIRHSFATHLLERGAGVKEIKEILGHKCIETTVLYTHFTVSNLKRIIKTYHPRENELYEELSAQERLRIIDVLRGVSPKSS